MNNMSLNYGTWVVEGTGSVTSSTWSSSTPYIIIAQNRSCGACDLYAYAYTNTAGAQHRVNNPIWNEGNANIVGGTLFTQSQPYVVINLFASSSTTNNHLLNAWAGNMVALLDGTAGSTSTKAYQMNF
jgi:hypothetical protein